MFTLFSPELVSGRTSIGTMPVRSDYSGLEQVGSSLECRVCATGSVRHSRLQAATTVTVTRVVNRRPSEFPTAYDRGLHSLPLVSSYLSHKTGYSSIGRALHLLQCTPATFEYRLIFSSEHTK